MKTLRITLLLIAALLVLAQPSTVQAIAIDDPKTLEIGQPAPPFNLQGIDDQFYTLESFSEAKLLAIPSLSSLPAITALLPRLTKNG